MGAAPTLPVEALGCEKELLKSQDKYWPEDVMLQAEWGRCHGSVHPLPAAVRKGGTDAIVSNTKITEVCQGGSFLSLPNFSLFLPTTSLPQACVGPSC